MNLCPNCATEIIPGAKFCHRCGDGIVEKTKPCPSCQHESPLASVFCHHCGFHFGKKARQQHHFEPAYPLEFDSEDLTEQVKSLFFNNLRRRVQEEHDVAKYSDYVERFYDSRFREIYNLRAEQIAEDVLLQWERFGTEALRDIDLRIDTGLARLFYHPVLSGSEWAAAASGHSEIRESTARQNRSGTNDPRFS